MQARDPARSPGLQSWGMVALVFGLVLICYWPALHGALLWDDPAHVTRPDLRTWSGLARIWTEVRATQQYYPVLHSAFWIEHRLWGDATLGYHLLNVALHATACCLLALLLRRLWTMAVRTGEGGATARRPIPAGAEWLAAILFAVHPVCVESVAWISEQKNTLSLVFYLLAGLWYLDFAAERRPRSYFWATAFFLLALGTKSVTATLPAALLVVLWWKNGKLSWRRDVAPLAPWLAAALASGLFTAWVERRLIGAEGVQFELAGLERLLLAGRIVWFYLGKLVWPAGQAFFYERWNVPAAAPAWAGYLVATVAVTAGLWIVSRRGRGTAARAATAALAAWLLFVGSLFPALGFFNVYPFVFSFVADHFQYLADIGLIAAAAAAFALALDAAPAWLRAVGRILGAAAVAVIVVLANRQSRLYVDDVTLFRATLAQNPHSWMAHHILGFRLAMSPGHRTEAIAEYREALRINPDYPDAHVGLALELAREPGRESEAIAHYERALQLKPNAADAHNDLALVLASLPGRMPEALAHYATALRLKPNFAEAHANLANALATLPGRLPEALTHYEAAVRLAPDSPEMRTAYAGVLARTPGRQAEAVAQFEAALRLAPDSAEAHANLGNVLAGMPGRLAEAVAQFETALRLNPQAAEVHYNLANALVTLPGRVPDAVAHYESALRLRPEFADAHANLANVLATLPARQADAVGHYEAALRISPDIAWVQLALALQLSSLPGRETEAADHARTALRLKPDYPEAHNCLAIVAAQQGRFDEARTHWEEALRLNPAYETARENLRRLEQMTRNAARGP